MNASDDVRALLREADAARARATGAESILCSIRLNQSVVHVERRIRLLGSHKETEIPFTRGEVDALYYALQQVSADASRRADELEARVRTVSE